MWWPIEDNTTNSFFVCLIVPYTSTLVTWVYNTLTVWVALLKSWMRFISWIQWIYWTIHVHFGRFWMRFTWWILGRLGLQHLHGTSNSHNLGWGSLGESLVTWVYNTLTVWVTLAILDEVHLVKSSGFIGPYTFTLVIGFKTPWQCELWWSVGYRGGERVGESRHI
jgi:hypothetical protein